MEIVVYHGDVEALRPLVEAWRSGADGSFHLDMDNDCLLRRLGAMMDAEHQAERALLVLQSKESRPLGFMGLLVTVSPIGTERIVNEHLWFVLPEHRGLSVAERFIEHAEVWGREHGCMQFSVTASRMANVQFERVCKMYERMGFRHYETSFIREIA